MDAIEAHARLLTVWHQAINLTAHRTPERMALENVADSLTALPFVPPGCRLIDLGSGSGYPGLALAVAGLVGEAALVDSIRKKARFLAVAAHAVSDAMRAAGGTPPTLAVIDSRAEELTSDGDHAEAWDLVTVRAVARMKRLAELALPLLRPGGSLICWKRDDGRGSLARELEEAQVTVGRLGGRRPEVHQVTLAPLADHRLVLVRRQH